MSRLHDERERMVAEQIEARGIRDEAVLEALRSVPRERFLPESLREFAYEDTALPIEAGQTISQPFIVALMIEALELGAQGRKAKEAVVLDVGTGSGYAAAVLAELAGRVISIERHAALADRARETLAAAGHADVEVIHGDGSQGYPTAAPYDGIVVAAGGPDIPSALTEQLAVGGRLVMPIGTSPRDQELVCITRKGPATWDTQSLGRVRFVPLVGAQGWGEEESTLPTESARAQRTRAPGEPRETVAVVARHAEPFESIEDADLEPLIRRIGDARIVLLGEASHGTSEFHRMRDRITRELVAHHGFEIVAAEADWPDAARIDHWVRHLERQPAGWTAFARFPTWMWRNREVAAFVDWLRDHNGERAPERRTGFYGLDLYSLFTSIDAVLGYLDDVDPESAAVARQRYGCLSPWEGDAAAYGAAVLRGRHRACEDEVRAMLEDLLAKRIAELPADGERLQDAIQNARLVSHAESYYRTMYYGSAESWNLRDRHMFDVLKTLLDFRGPGSRAVVWAHNSHVGDARATEMSARRELNLGQLSRQAWGNRSFHVGFGTDHGSVAAASDWGGRWRSRRCCPLIATATSGSVTKPSGRRSCSICTGEPRRASTRRDWSARSASSTGRRRSWPATTCRPSCPVNSTSTSGSTRRRPSRPCRRSISRARPTPIPSVSDRCSRGTARMKVGPGPPCSRPGPRPRLRSLLGARQASGLLRRSGPISLPGSSGRSPS